MVSDEFVNVSVKGSIINGPPRFDFIPVIKLDSVSNSYFTSPITFCELYGVMVTE